MSGFKQNTRFSSLISDEVSNKERKGESEKKDKLMSNNDTKKYGLDNSFKKSNNNKYYSDDKLNDNRKREEERKIKEEQINLLLTTENFPELAPKPIHTICTTSNGAINYASISEKLITPDVENNNVSTIDIDYKNLLPGWTLFKINRDKNNITVQSKDLNEQINIDTSFEILDALVDLHENRTNEYIENWGNDEWEKMFKFPNYDYNYFDKLDELYYVEMESEHSDGDDDYNDTNFDYDNYDDY